MKVVSIIVQAMLLCSCLAQEDVSRPPNIIILMADDMGYGDTNYNGHSHMVTPNLNKMRRNSLNFNRFYSQSPVCAPTRASVLTGRHPYRTTVRNVGNSHLPLAETTLAEAINTLKASDGSRVYTTGHFGKWHLGSLVKGGDVEGGFWDGHKSKQTENFSPPWLHGFDVCFSTESAVPTYNPYENQFTEIVRRKGIEITPELKAQIDAGTHEEHKLVRYFKYDQENGARVAPAEELVGDDSKLLMQNALDFMRKAKNDDQPFFTVIWFHTPHNPCYSSPESLAKYSDKYADFNELKPEFGGRYQQYTGCITDMDRQVGKLRRKLRDWGIENNTVVTFTSDNAASTANGGENTPFKGYKGEIFEGGIRVPSLIEWPTKIIPRQVEDMAVTNDYYKTVLDIIGLEDPQSFDSGLNDGVSLVPLFKNDGSKLADRVGGGLVFAHSKMKAFIGQDYKLLLENYNKNDEVAHFYDMKTNQSESIDKNLINEPDLQAEILRMREQIKLSLNEWSDSSDKNKATEE
ncbi:MAG: sulfatase-like hydrolase/transferase [Lentisphaeraceae bacterium]|nr:sulfatase-like hydrolase/transferase [Lentisphaeraceae bacterium]